jgi:hypothetical protein
MSGQGKSYNIYCKKAVEKHGKRYSGWLEEHPDAEEELSSVLRDKVWEICEDIGEDGFTLDQSVKSLLC